MAYKFTHRIEFGYEYTFQGKLYKDAIEYCTLRITEENYDELEDLAKSSELELQINPTESYYTNFVKIIQDKHKFDYPNPDFVPLDQVLCDEDYHKFVRIFQVVYPPIVINKAPNFEMVKKTIQERNIAELKNMNFEKDVTIHKIVYRRINFQE